MQENIDTNSSGGRHVFNIFASLAEFARDLIRERTNAGLQATRARGHTGGRPSSLARQTADRQKALWQKDMTVAQIGEVAGVIRSTLVSSSKEDLYGLPNEQTGNLVNWDVTKVRFSPKIYSNGQVNVGT